ncbi:MAG: cell envelope integrity protein TolA [Chitinophagales bacterium]
MKQLFKIWLFKLHTWLNKLLIKHVDISESNEVVKVITKKIGITWIDMENHVSITNKFIVPYTLKEVKLTYYNDAGQNVGYLHFKGDEYIGPFAKKMVKMPAKMSNITALFNMVRLMVVDDIKTRTVGTSTIKLLGMHFELPIDDIMMVDKDKVQLEEETEEQKQKRLEEKAKRAEEKATKQAERKEKQELRLAMLAEKRAEKKAQMLERIEKRKEKVQLKKEARQRLKRIKSLKTKENEREIKKPQENLTASNNLSNENPTIEQESSTPDQDKSYQDPLT